MTAPGTWRLALASALDLEVLGYLRTDDGFVTGMHDLVPHDDGTYRVVFFNPGSNASQVSRLRLINRGAESAEVTIEGIDDEGESPGMAVRLSVPAGGARTVTAQELESEAARSEALRDLSGALGDGAGKWRLRGDLGPAHRSDEPAREPHRAPDQPVHRPVARRAGPERGRAYSRRPPTPSPKVK